MHVKILMHFMILLFIHLLLIRKSKEKIVPCGGAVRVELKKIPPRNEHDQVAPLFGLSAPPQNVTCHRALTRSLSLSLEWSSRAPCVIFIALLYREPPLSWNPWMPHRIQCAPSTEWRCIKLPTTQSQSGLVFMTQKCFTLWLSRQPTDHRGGVGGGATKKGIQVCMDIYGAENKEELLQCGNRKIVKVKWMTATCRWAYISKVKYCQSHQGKSDIDGRDSMAIKE